MILRSIGCVLCAALTLNGSEVCAQQGTLSEAVSDYGPDDGEAEQLFNAGQFALNAGRFEEAYRHFERAFELSPRPSLLFNMGVAADRGGDHERAIEAFRRFLVAEPGFERRRMVEARIDVLEEIELAAHSANEPSAVNDPESNESREERSESRAEDETLGPSSDEPSRGASQRRRVAGWALGAVAVAVGTTALALHLHGHSRFDTLEASCAPNCDPDEVDGIRTEVRAAQVLFPVAATLALVAVVLFVRGSGDDEVTVAVGPGTIHLAGAF